MRKVFFTLSLFAMALSVHAQERSRVDSVSADFMQKNLKSLASSVDVKGAQAAVQKQITDSLLRMKSLLVAPLSDAARLLKSPISLQKAELSYDGVYDNNYLGDKRFMTNGILDVDGMVMGVPVQFVNRNGQWFNQTNELFSFRFDREIYIKQLQSQFRRQVDGRRILAAVTDPFAAIKQRAEAAVRSELGQINQQYQELLQDDITSLGGLDQMMNMDISAIRSKLMPASALTGLNEAQILYEQLKARKDLGERIDTAQFRFVLNQLKRAEGIKRLLTTVETHKKNWETSGLVKQLKDFELLKQSSLEKAMTEPSTVLTLARNQLSLNGLQRFFLKINKLNFGQSALNRSALTFENFLNSGGMSEFMNKGKSLMLLMGKTQNGASLTDVPFTNSVFQNSLAKAVQFGKSNQKGAMQFSFANFQEGFNGIGNLGGLSQLRQSFVTGISKRFSISKYGAITTEISRSVSRYNNKAAGEASNLQKLMSADNLSSNTSLHINYTDEYPGIGLQYQVDVKKVGLGYDNPGSPFLNTGSQEAGVSVRKNFLDRRLQVMVRTNRREYSYGMGATGTWVNSYSVFDVKWKLDKTNTISLRYLPNRMNRLDETGRHRATTLDYLAFDGNFNKRIAGLYYNSYASLLYQQNQFASGPMNYDADNFGLIWNQSIALKKLMLYWNTQVNRAQNSSQLVYLNSSVNSEIGTSLMFLKVVNLSTSFSYNAIDQWYKQIGVRESLDVLVTRRISVSGFIDLRKNLQIYQPLIFGLVTGSVRAHYSFK